MKAELQQRSAAPWGAGQSKVHAMSSHRVRTIMFTYTLTAGVMDAVEAVEEAVGVLLKGQLQQQHQQQCAGAAPPAPAAGSGAKAAVPAPTEPAAAAAAAAGGEVAADGGDVESGLAARAAAAAPSAAGIAAGDGAGAEAPPPVAGVHVIGREIPSRQASQAAKEGFAPSALPWYSRVKQRVAIPPRLRWLVMCLLLEAGVPAYAHIGRFITHDVRKSITTRGYLASSLRSKVTQAGIKYFICLSLVLLMLLGLAARYEVVRQYRPIYAFSVSVLSMSERVEATVSKVVLRIAGVAVGGVLGYVCMLRPELASNPWALATVVCSFTAFLGFNAQHQFRVAVAVSFVTFSTLVLCQYRPGCSDCSGDTNLFAARVSSVVLGCTVPVLLSQLVLPWYNTEHALSVLGSTLCSMHAVLRTAYRQFYVANCQASVHYKRLASRMSDDGDDTDGGGAACAADGASVCLLVANEAGNDRGGGADGKDRMGRGSDPAAAAAAGGAAGRISSDGGGGGGDITVDRDPSVSDGARRSDAGTAALMAACMALPEEAPLNELQARIAGPLVGVQVALVKHATAWRRGLLATPKVVPRLLVHEFMLLDRLAALILTLTGPSITGQFTGWSFEHFVKPMHPHTLAVLAAVGHVAAATRVLLDGDHSPAAHGAISAAVSALELERIKLRHVVLTRRRQMFMSLRDIPDDQLPYYTHPDDFVSLASFIYALVKFIDKATQVARIALVGIKEEGDEQHADVSATGGATRGITGGVGGGMIAAGATPGRSSNSVSMRQLWRSWLK